MMNSPAGMPDQDRSWESSALDLTLTIDDDRWADVLGPDPDAVVRPLVAAAIAAGRRTVAGARIAGKTGDAEIMIGVTFADDDTVRAYNRDYRGRDSATNVLSFAFQDGEQMPLPPGAPVELGDLVLAYETIFREADLQQRPFAHHLMHLIVHGVLHLLGHDHMTDRDADVMERLEADILDGFRVPDPYQPETHQEETRAAKSADGMP